MSEVWQLGALELAAEVRTREVSAADLTETGWVPQDTLRPVLPASFLALPAAGVPCRTADGLPVGIQVSGDRSTDLRCLASTRQLHDAVGAPIDPVRS